MKTTQKYTNITKVMTGAWCSSCSTWVWLGFLSSRITNTLMWKHN